MINRRQNDERRARKRLIEEAVQKSRVPGALVSGFAPAGGDTVTPTDGTTPDENGNTIKNMLWDIDEWNTSQWN